MSCILRIEGKDFDVKNFIKETKLEPYLIFLKGEKNGIKNEIHKTNGCSFDLSFAEFDEFEKQKKDVIKFLTSNFGKLKTLDKFGLNKNDTATIDFAVKTNAKKYPIQSDYISPILLKIVSELNIGIMISHYDDTYFE